MEVILRETIAKLGHAGEVVDVKDGYARNYLLPRGLAYPATPANKRRVAAETQHRTARLATEQGDAERLAAQLAELELRFTAKAGEGDRLFGSITSADIAEELAARGAPVDKRAIALDEPIKVIGDHTVPVKLHPDVRAEVRVRVEKEA